MIFKLMYSLPQEKHHLDGKTGLSSSDLERIADISTRIKTAWEQVESNPKYSGEIEISCERRGLAEYCVEFLIQFEGGTYEIWAEYAHEIFEGIEKMSEEEWLYGVETPPEMPLLHDALFEFLDICSTPDFVDVFMFHLSHRILPKYNKKAEFDPETMKYKVVDA